MRRARSPDKQPLAAGEGAVLTARLVLWPAFFAGILIAWAALWVMGQEVRGFAVYGPDFWLALCRAAAADLAYLPLVAMWAVMAAAMMAPTFVPALRTFLDLPPPAGRAGQAVALVAGYLAVWAAAAFGFAALQAVLGRAGLMAPDGRSLSLWLNAGIFLVAGLYQFSRLKSACLSRCRAPMTFFMTHWRPGAWPAFHMGARMGTDCLGCCWALMALAFVGGMSNLLWMGLATALMVVEKLPNLGELLTRPLGWLLGALAAASAAMALGGF